MVNAPEIVILSQERACVYEPHGREVCISITGPDKPKPELSNAFAAVLRLTFTDIARPSPFHWDQLFNEDHARRIVDFVRDMGDVDRIVIHCMAGQGRSAGVGMGICEVFSWDLGDMETQYPLWNTWVRTELVRVGREMTAHCPATSNDSQALERHAGATTLVDVLDRVLDKGIVIEETRQS